MFGSQVLEVGIGVIFFYLILSIGFTAFNEMISLVIARRSKDLKKGIGQLLQDPQRIDAFYKHPLIKSLSKDGTPSYIPSRTFAVAIMSTVGETVTGYEEIRSRLAAEKNNPVSRQLLALVEAAQGDMEKVLKNIENWFDHTMERVSGWYKRWTMMITFWSALVLCFLLNADSIMVAKLLWSDAGFRASVDKSAITVSKNAQIVSTDPHAAIDSAGKFLYAVQQYHDANFPLGWADSDQNVVVSQQASVLRVFPSGKPTAETLRWWLYKVAGILFTVFAVMLGAPFWFDVLGSVVKIRSTGTPHTGS
jgi:hypothetical protein